MLTVTTRHLFTSVVKCTYMRFDAMSFHHTCIKFLFQLPWLKDIGIGTSGAGWVLAQTLIQCFNDIHFHDIIIMVIIFCHRGMFSAHTSSTYIHTCTCSSQRRNFISLLICEHIEKFVIGVCV